MPKRGRQDSPAAERSRNLAPHGEAARSVRLASVVRRRIRRQPSRDQPSPAAQPLTPPLPGFVRGEVLRARPRVGEPGDRRTGDGASRAAASGTTSGARSLPRGIIGLISVGQQVPEPRDSGTRPAESSRAAVPSDISPVVPYSPCSVELIPEEGGEGADWWQRMPEDTGATGNAPRRTQRRASTTPAHTASAT